MADSYNFGRCRVAGSFYTGTRQRVAGEANGRAYGTGSRRFIRRVYTRYQAPSSRKLTRCCHCSRVHTRRVYCLRRSCSATDLRWVVEPGGLFVVLHLGLVTTALAYRFVCPGSAHRSCCSCRHLITGRTAYGSHSRNSCPQREDDDHCGGRHGIGFSRIGRACNGALRKSKTLICVLNVV